MNAPRHENRSARPEDLPAAIARLTPLAADHKWVTGLKQLAE
jgi:hypothetical protein